MNNRATITSTITTVLTTCLILSCGAGEAISPPVDAEVPQSSDSAQPALDSVDTPLQDTSLTDTSTNDVQQRSDVSTDINDAIVLRDTSERRDTAADTRGPERSDSTDSTDGNNSDPDATDSIALSPCPTSIATNEFALTLHRLTASGALGEELKPLDKVEIVQGPQGGVHIEFGYRAQYDGANELKMFASFNGETYLDALAPPVGFGGSPLTVLFLSPDGAGYDSQLNLVIFEQNEAFHYEERPCCAVATVSILDPVTKDPMATATQAVELYCEDVF